MKTIDQNVSITRCAFAFAFIAALFSPLSQALNAAETLAGSNQDGDRIEWANGDVWTGVTVVKLSKKDSDGKTTFILEVADAPKGHAAGEIDRPFQALRLRGSEAVTEKPVNPASYQMAREQGGKALVGDLKPVNETDAWNDMFVGKWAKAWDALLTQPENSMKGEGKDGAMLYIQTNVTIPIIILKDGMLYALVRNTGKNAGVVDGWFTGLDMIVFSHESHVTQK